MQTDLTTIARTALAESPDFWEYPSHTLTLELCRALARRDKRNINQALRGCARELAAKTREPRLRKLLIGMSGNPFAEADIATLHRANERIESHMVRAMMLVEREKNRLHNLYPDKKDYEAAVTELARERRRLNREAAA